MSKCQSFDVLDFKIKVCCRKFNRRTTRKVLKIQYDEIPNVIGFFSQFKPYLQSYCSYLFVTVHISKTEFLIVYPIQVVNSV